jgi:hypothetical protein
MCKALDPISSPTKQTNKKQKPSAELPCPTRTVKGSPEKKIIPDESMNLHKGIRSIGNCNHL